MDSTAVIRITENWVRDVVVGLNLCPFASVPLQAGLIRFSVCAGQTPEEIYRALLSEMDTLVNLPETEVETGLFIAPQGLDAFDDYLELLYSADEAIAEAGLDGVLQLASFHPDYRFEGSEEDDPANYTNRSPFPMFHLIREAPMAHALAHYPHPEQIPERNVQKMRELGLAEVRDQLRRCREKT